MDPHLFDLLWRPIGGRRQQPIQVVCAIAPQPRDVARPLDGVAQTSQHTEGHAMILSSPRRAAGKNPDGRPALQRAAWLLPTSGSPLSIWTRAVSVNGHA